MASQRPSAFLSSVGASRVGLRLDAILRVLVVEDDDDDALLTTAVLRRVPDTRFKVDRAHDGAEALSKLGAFSYDACLLDYRLGHESGLDVLRTLRAHGHDVPVIMLSSVGAHEIDLAASEAGADDYLDKVGLQPAMLERSVRYARGHREHARVLKRKNEELARLHEEKNFMLGMAAHDLRNPLGVIAGFAQLLRMRSMSAEDASKMAERIEASASRMMTLVDDLLDVSALTLVVPALDRRTQSLPSLARHVLADLDASARSKGIEVELAAGEVPDLAVDASRMTQVLLNLVGNAIKYSHAGQRVVLRIERDGNELRIAVEDHGIGIEPELMARLFKPFQKGNGHGTAGEKSTGLGLFIVSRIVEAHRGTIQVTSTPGEGSTFVVRLPLAVGPD